MEKILEANKSADFGKEIIPEVIETSKVAAYVFDGFWEDIGTIKAFYDTNIDIASITPAFNFYDESAPIYTHRRHLPATKVNFCNISSSLTSEGSIITNAYIRELNNRCQNAHRIRRFTGWCLLYGGLILRIRRRKGFECEKEDPEYRYRKGHYHP